MTRLCLCRGAWAALLSAPCLLLANSAAAAPAITKLSLAGLQVGGTTTLVIEGRELTPEPTLFLGTPIAEQRVKPGAKPNRVEVDVTLDAATTPGIYLLRLASAAGVSNAMAVGVDGLPQTPFALATASLPVAMSGAISGATVMTTSFEGKAGQRVVVEVECRRLASNVNPVLRLYGARRVQMAWSQGQAAIGGDARLAVTLPTDGQYMVELHDALYRPGTPNVFRLKIGELRYADMVFPLAVERNKPASLEFVSTSFPRDARATLSQTTDASSSQIELPAPWPVGVPLITGSRPRLLLSDHAEFVEVPSADSSSTPAPQATPAAPVGINGRLGQKREQDRFTVPVTAGKKLRFEVQARRLGSPLDAVLTLYSEKGVQLATNDDRPGASDPAIDFTVPGGTNAVVVAIKDLRGFGGEDFIYRIEVSPANEPDFSLAVTQDRLLVPNAGAEVLHVRAKREGYQGPIALSFPGLPAEIKVAGGEIPAGASEALVTLTASGSLPAPRLTQVVGEAAAPAQLRRSALVENDNPLAKLQPWLANDVAVATTPASKLQVAWSDSDDSGKTLAGMPRIAKLKLTRVDGASGPVKLTLLTSQPPPKKTVKVANKDQIVDDVDRTIRFETGPLVAADKNEVETQILIPGDLPVLPYDLAISAELLDADGKTAKAAAVTPARRLAVVSPMTIELASDPKIEARAGVGPTGKFSGKLVRGAGFTVPATISLSGLPMSVTSPSTVVADDKPEFELEVALPFGTTAGELKGVTLVAVAENQVGKSKLVARSNAIPVTIKVVPGEKPPAEKPLLVFEDQAEFVAALNIGSGKAALRDGDKYSGAASLEITPEGKSSAALPGLGLKIRKNPGPGEYRYLQFAWKKQGGEAICVQIGHDGKFGPDRGIPGKFRYDAGAGPESFGAAVNVDKKLPKDFTLITRDLFADFGEFTLTGLGFAALDGAYALFDHVYLGKSPGDFELIER